MQKKGAGTNSAEHPLGHLAIGSCPFLTPIIVGGGSMSIGSQYYLQNPAQSQGFSRSCRQFEESERGRRVRLPQ